MNGSERDRIEFNSGVPQLLFKRVNTRCSVPRCKNPTTGPCKEIDRAINMGIACHIYSASKRGPRGWGEKSEEFISSIENGIWCCSYHGDLIDKNKGKDYPVGDLFAWKALAEARAFKEMNDVPSPLGWVESIVFSDFLKVPLPKITLSRRTLMWGASCTGKTSLLEFSAAISRSQYMERFTGMRVRSDGRKTVCKANIVYSTADSLSREISVKVEGQKILRSEGATQYLLPPGDLEVIYCSEEDIRKLDYEDDVDFLMRALNVDKCALLTLTDISNPNLLKGKIEFEQGIKTEVEEEGEVEAVSSPRVKENGDPYYELIFKYEENGQFVHFDSLSSSERLRLILGLQITKAREVCKQRLTLLLIESLSINLDGGNFEYLLNVLEKEDFQVIVSLPGYRESDILDKQQSGVTLKNLGYLKPWRLSVVGL